MRYSKLMELGERLKESNVKRISTKDLSLLIMKATGVIRPETIKRYMTLLKEAGYIKFKDGAWEVCR